MNAAQQPAIVFLTEKFLKFGGVETRVRQYRLVWQKQGWKSYVSSLFQRQKGKGFLHGLGRYSLWNTFLLLCWRVWKGVRVVEWQSGGRGKMRFYPCLLRLAGIKTGVVFHGQTSKLAADIIKKVDYAFCISRVQQQRNSFLKECVCIENGIIMQEPIWHFSGQQKAILISRCDGDKFLSIMSFIHFCLKCRIPFEIVGDGNLLDRLKRLAYTLCSKRGLDEPIFWGVQPTFQFLRSHSHRYLFVAGVGQVALEGASVGYPVLICPLIRHSCFFLHGTNLSALGYCNFSPHNMQEVAPFLSDIKYAADDLLTLQRGESQRFVCAGQQLEPYRLENIQDKYWRAIWH